MLFYIISGMLRQVAVMITADSSRELEEDILIVTNIGQRNGER